MGSVVTTTYEITCDNPVCPGNDLDPASYTGWIQVTAVIHMNGDLPVVSPPNFYCSPACSGSIEQNLTAAAAAREATGETQPA